MSSYSTGGVQRLNFEITKVHEWPEERKALYKEKQEKNLGPSDTNSCFEFWKFEATHPFVQKLPKGKREREREMNRETERNRGIKSWKWEDRNVLLLSQKIEQKGIIVESLRLKGVNV